MQPDENSTSINNAMRQRQNRGFSMFYWEQDGNRYYLRFTPLAVLLVIGLTIVSLAAILIMFSVRSQHSASKETNVNIITTAPSPYSPDKPLIQQAPPQTPPSVRKPPVVTMPSPPTPPKTSNNANEQLTPMRTTQPDNKGGNR